MQLFVVILIKKDTHCGKSLLLTGFTKELKSKFCKRNYYNKKQLQNQWRCPRQIASLRNHVVFQNLCKAILMSDRKHLVVLSSTEQVSFTGEVLHANQNLCGILRVPRYQSFYCIEY